MGEVVERDEAERVATVPGATGDTYFSGEKYMSPEAERVATVPGATGDTYFSSEKYMSPEVEIVPGSGRLLHKRRKRRRLFGKAARLVFLEHLAATCNVQASAAAAEVAVSTVYANRMRDPAFAAGWDAALAQGYARLEAALIERALRGEGRTEARGDKEVEGPYAPAEIDWVKAMELMRHHQRGLARIAQRNPAHVPKRLPIEQVTATLIRKLKKLGVEPERRDS